MTPEHGFFIPIVFALGVVVGALLGRRPSGEATRSEEVAPKPRVNGRAVLFPLLAFLAFFVVSHLLPMHGGPHALADALGGRPIFDQRPSYSAVEVYSRIAAFGTEGRAAYRHMTFTTDLVFPLVLLAFLVQLGRFLVERASTLPKWATRAVLALPLLWFAADLGENATIHHLLSSFPERHDGLASVLGVVTVAKFALLLCAAAAAAWTSVVVARSRARC